MKQFTFDEIPILTKSTNDSLPIDFIRVTVIGAGVEKLEMLAANNVY